MFDLVNLMPYFKFSIFIAAGLTAAYFIEVILLRKLKKLAQRTTWKADDMVLGTLKGFTFVMVFLLALYLGLANSPFNPSIVSQLLKFIQLLFIALATIICSKIAVNAIRYAISRVQGVIPSISLFTNLTRVAIWAIGALIILQSLGISITPILTAMGVFGLAVALALQDTLSNLFAGIQILLSRQVRPGDFIKLENLQEGFVEDISWRNSVIRTFSNHLIIIPNSKLSASIVVNANLPDLEVSVPIKMGIGYNSDLDLVEKVSIEAGREIQKTVPGGIPEFVPVVRFNGFGDFSINFTLILRAKSHSDQFLMIHEAHKLLHRRFRENHIEIPFPTSNVFLKKETS